jgi:predicted metal-binding membrane protein
MGTLPLAARQRLAVLAGLGGVTLLAWADLVRLAREMDADMARGVTCALHPWSGADFALTFAMWAVMMVGMMVPSAVPMSLLFATVARRARAQNSAVAPTFVFVAGYVAVWTGFSALATAAQWALERVALLSPMLVSTSPLFGGALLGAAGVYQWTSLKEACLERCRAPASFLAAHWRTGGSGAFRMGADYGVYCLGCCWLLMGLLFFGGVMNLLWVAAIALFVLLEKVAPQPALFGRAAGAALVLAGGAEIATWLRAAH